jgi:hypothetical protein
MCKANRVGEPHEFVGLSGGAASETGECGEGFLDLFVHPCESAPFGPARAGDAPKTNEEGAWVEIVRDTTTGQFDLYFCSTACLRRFLNECVDELERRLREADPSRA